MGNSDEIEKIEYENPNAYASFPNGIVAME